MRFAAKIHSALDELGYTLPNWRIKIINRDIIHVCTDLSQITIEVYKFRCHKPCQRLIIIYNEVRQCIYTDHISYYNL